MQLVLFNSFIWFVVICVSLILSLLASESNKSTISSFSSLVLFLIIFYIGNGLEQIKPLLTIHNGLSYFGIGILVMFITFFIWGYKNRNKKESDLPDSEEKASKAIRTIVFWPITIIYFLFSDVIIFVKDLVYNFFSKSLNLLFNAGRKL